MSFELRFLFMCALPLHSIVYFGLCLDLNLSCEVIKSFKNVILKFNRRIFVIAAHAARWSTKGAFFGMQIDNGVILASIPSLFLFIRVVFHLIKRALLLMGLVVMENSIGTNNRCKPPDAQICELAFGCACLLFFGVLAFVTS